MLEEFQNGQRLFWSRAASRALYILAREARKVSGRFRIVVHYKGLDPRLWSDVDPGRGGQQYCPAPTQISLLTDAIEHHLKERGVVAGAAKPLNAKGDYRLEIRTRLYSDSGFAWSLLRCFVNYQLRGDDGIAISSGLSRAIVAGPAGPFTRLKTEVMVDAGLPLCGQDIAERVMNELAKQRGALPNQGKATYGLPVWIGLTYGATNDGSTARVLTPAHYLAPSGDCYDLARKPVQRISKIGGSLFVMSDRERPQSSEGVPNG